VQPPYRAEVGDKLPSQRLIEEKALCVEASDAPLIDSHETPCFPVGFAAVVVINQRPGIISSMPSGCGDPCRNIEFFCKELASRSAEARIKAANFEKGSTPECAVRSLYKTRRDEAVRRERYARE
jgi:hypothetical protein